MFVPRVFPEKRPVQIPAQALPVRRLLFRNRDRLSVRVVEEFQSLHAQLNPR
jgi:hypothetical protein